MGIVCKQPFQQRDIGKQFEDSFYAAHSLPPQATDQQYII